MPLARQTLRSTSALAVSRAGGSQAESGLTIAREKRFPGWLADTPEIVQRFINGKADLQSKRWLRGV